MPRANWDVLVRYPIVIPSEQVIKSFNRFVQAVVSQIHRLIFCNINLRRTRDLLLPKLISGEIDVEGLEIETGEEISTVVGSPEPVGVEEVALASEQGTLWG